MKKENLFKIKISILTLCLNCIPSLLHSQNETKIKDIDLTKYRLYFSNSNMNELKVNDSLSLGRLYSLYQNTINTDFNKMSHRANIGSYSIEQTYKLSDIYLTSFNQKTSYIGVGDINNMGMRTKWKFSKRFYIDVAFSLSKQDSYILYNSHIVPYFDLKLDYSLSSTLSINLQAKYVLKQNSDPFMLRMDLLPKSEVMLSAEYKPKSNIKMQIATGIQEDIVKKNSYQFILEGKTTISF